MLSHIARQKEATGRQIALASRIAQQPWLVPIPATTKLHRLEENMANLSTELFEAELSEVNEVESMIDASGNVTRKSHRS